MSDDLSDLAAILDEPKGAEPPPSSKPGLRARLLDGTVARRRVVAIVALLVATNAAWGVMWFREGAPRRADSRVHGVAERFAKSLVTFDYRTLEADIQRMRSDATGKFSGELESVLGGGTGVFKDALAGAQAHSSGKVRSVDVTSVGDDTATALVVVDQTISNIQTPEPQTVTRRLQLTMVRTAKGWKVDSVDAREGT